MISAKRTTFRIVLAVLLQPLPAIPILAAEPLSVPVSAQDAQAWIRQTVPLPKQIEIESKVTVPAARIQILGAAKAGVLGKQAVEELRERIGTRQTTNQTGDAAFSVLLEIPEVKVAALAALKNADQAYQIIPDGAATSLRLVALTPRGLYYAAKTTQQLLRVQGDGQVEIPLARVTDWPDMEKRGLWGSDCCAHLRWMADRKLNIAEQIADRGVDAQGKPYARLKGGQEPMVEEGPRYAVEPVPVVLHLEQVAGRSLFRAYPELKAQGGQEGAICYSKPGFAGILADWLVQLGSLPGVSEVDVWMAENLHQQGGCQCAGCRKEDRNILELRTILAAWHKARETLPRLTIFVLTSEETEKSNPRLLRELPPEVKLWYYHSLLTYNTSEAPMLRNYLSDAAKAGRWVGVCPSVTAFVNFAHPFTGADFVHYRLNEFVDKGMSGLIGYATPRVHYSLFNIEAVAEWSWNARGRAPREFALSWAVRRGMRDPAKFAAWSETLGPVAWDVYGSDWPGGELRNHPPPVAKRLRQGGLGGLGSNLWGVYRSPWGDIKNLQQLNADVARADQAVQLAREMKDAAILQESLVVQGYIRSLEALYELRQIIKPEKPVPPARREDARRYFTMYADGLEQAAAALPGWEETVRRPGDAQRFTAKPVEVIRGMVKQMQTAQAELGL